MDILRFLKVSIIILIMLSLLNAPEVEAESRLDIHPTKISSSAGTKKITTNNVTSTVKLDSIDFEPNHIINGNLQLFTNQSVFFGMAEYGIKINFHNHHYDNEIMQSTSIRNYENGSIHYYVEKLPHVVFKTVIFISLQISHEATLDNFIELEINYDFSVLEQPENLELDEYESYILMSTIYPKRILIEGTTMYNYFDDLNLMVPQLRALNETNIGVNGSDYTYFYNVEVSVKIHEMIDVDSYSTFMQMVMGTESKRSNKVRVNDLGTYTFNLENITNEHITPIGIEHSGAGLELELLEVKLFVPAMADAPLNLILSPAMQVVSTGVAAGMSFVSYKIIAVFGESRIRSRLEAI